jgi:hypothetical protein
MSVATRASERTPELPRVAECRVYERQACGLETTLQPIAARSDQDVVWPATIRDISEGGLGLIMARRFERGAGLAIELPGSGKSPAQTLLAKVVHATSLPGNRWLLGCYFVSRLSEEEVRTVVALAEALQTDAPQASTPIPNARPDLPAAVPDARPSPPAPVPSVRPSPPTPAAPTAPAGSAPVLTNLWFEGEAQDGQIVRIPVRHLYLKGTWPLPPGTTLRVWAGDKSTNPAGLLIKVIDCRKQNNGWTVRYRPVQPTSADVLRKIGFSD